MCLDMLVDDAPVATPLRLVASTDLAGLLAGQAAPARARIEQSGFSGATGQVVQLPDADGSVWAGVGGGISRRSAAAVAMAVPSGVYQIAGLSAETATEAALGWALGSYSFDRLKRADDTPKARLVWPERADRSQVRLFAEATTLVRDLINLPPNLMVPNDLADAARRIASVGGATLDVITGDDLLSENYPLVHAVGRASTQPPCLIDLRWGDASHPRVTLVGKGVCFDTGGSNLKQAPGMLLMKKDMGGAAHVLALAQMIMAARLPVRLRVLVPAVENSLSGDAMRPLDVIKARNGLSVEIGNTDAEGRLILADALAEAVTETPDLLIDFATLTGAATTALGTDIGAMLTNDDGLAAEAAASSAATDDPLWRLPLWAPYAPHLMGKSADLINIPDMNIGSISAAGAIYGGLFLQNFVASGTPWIHLDIFAWNLSRKDGRPEGGEAHGLLAMYDLIARRWPAAG